MLKRITYTLLLSIIFSSVMVGRQLTSQEALYRLNGNTAAKHRLKGQAIKQLKLVHTEAGQDLNLFYVYEPMAGGDAVFVAADDLLPEVLAYGISGFSSKNMPPQLREWIKYYRNVSTQVISSGTPLKTTTTVNQAVQPLMTTYWDQSEPYNNLCTEKMGYEVPTGCVATAMAQIMYYWKYPIQGVGSHSYKTTDDITMTADFGSTYYDWEHMQAAYGNYLREGESKYSNMPYDDVQAAAVSMLSFHCGVSVDMNYTKDGSGSQDIYAARALTKYFDYNKGIRYESRDYYNDAEWEQMLQEELQANRPVMYCGVTVEKEGHCFVCDGYDGNGYYHFNWGWSGVGNGYYLITGYDVLHPKIQGTGGSLTSSAFDQSQSILLNVRPKQDSDSEDIYVNMCAGNTIESSQGDVPCFVIMSDQSEVSNLVRGETYGLYGGFYNISVDKVNVELGAILRNIQTGDEYICDALLATDIDPFSGYSYYSFTVDAVPENGTYEVYAAYKPLNNEGKSIGPWMRMPVQQGLETYKVNVTGTLPAVRITDMQLSKEDDGTIGQSPKLNVSLAALTKVSKISLTANIYEWNSNTIINYYSIATSLSMNKGEFKDINGLVPKMTKKLEPGKAYRMEISSRSYAYNLGDTEMTKYFFVVGDDSTTGITSLSNEERIFAPGLFDLSGRKVNDTTRPGIYIQNGRKIIKQ